MKLPFLCFVVLLVSTATAQLNYVESTFDVHVDTNIKYGTVTNYAGQEEDLYLDIYKPIGDANCSRPCIVLVHGGSWIAGSKDDAGIVNMATSFAEKGWVVAAINYRLGTHKTGYHVMYALCNDEISTPCGYVADSAEVFRANYRGQQDAKGAIRFMKNRWMQDSTDVDNYFIVGESAGGFIAYAATFMNEETEKPVFCEAIDDAPTPDPDLVSCLPADYSLERPDLGPVHGSLNTAGHDASVQGVGSFYGAMIDFDMLLDETSWPVMYLYHQGSDVVVNYNYGRILGRVDWECFSPLSLCQNYARYPRAHGSKSIDDYFSTLPDPPTRVVDIIDNYEYMNDCFDNGHSIDNWVTRSDNMIMLFAERVADNGNVPNTGPCALSIDETNPIQFQLFPNPSNGIIYFNHPYSDPLHLTVFALDGNVISNSNVLNKVALNLAPGVYIFQIEQDNQIIQKRVIVH